MARVHRERPPASCTYGTIFDVAKDSIALSVRIRYPVRHHERSLRATMSGRKAPSTPRTPELIIPRSIVSDLRPETRVNCASIGYRQRRFKRPHRLAAARTVFAQAYDVTGRTPAPTWQVSGRELPSLAAKCVPPCATESWRPRIGSPILCSRSAPRRAAEVSRGEHRMWAATG